MKTAYLLAGALALAVPFVPSLAMAQTYVAPPTVQVAPNQSGQWVQLSDGSSVFVPQTPQTYVAGGVQYYIYVPAYGWNWYASPWGAGPVVRDTHPWPYGFRAWHATDRRFYNYGARPQYRGHVEFRGGGQYHGGGQYRGGGGQYHGGGGHPQQHDGHR